MARDREYGELVSELRGKRVAVWACNTCAGICGVGGLRNARSLSERLKSDGVSVTATESCTACCLMLLVDERKETVQDCDAIVALCCDVGASVISKSTGVKIINPVKTFGPGYADAGGTPHLLTVHGDETLKSVTERSGCFPNPFRACALII